MTKKDKAKLGKALAKAGAQSRKLEAILLEFAKKIVRATLDISEGEKKNTTDKYLIETEKEIKALFGKGEK